MENTISIQYHKTRLAEFILGSFQNQLCLLDFRYRRMRSTVDKRIQNGLNAKFIEQPNSLLTLVCHQLEQYIEGDRSYFDIPLLLVGSSFQKRVWKALLQVPYNSTSSYLDLAKKLQLPKAVRAIASANGANAIAIIIPCHRIIGSDGSMVGYGGGTPVKKRLLKLEAQHRLIDDDDKYHFIGLRYNRFNGAFYTAVKTTGIFCLPSCRAKKPLRKNVVFYNSKPQALENGFRACKLCNP